MGSEAALREARDRPPHPVARRETQLGEAVTPRRMPRWRALARQDRLAVALLVAFPIVLYVPFSLAGHPLLPGDDLTQNYPLRLLAGQTLQSGHLPTWDPYIWSGTPLLAGWNGGVMFPTTWLFAVLPGAAAWTAGYVGTAVVASLGTFVLLRRLACKATAATLGALAFTYTGFMSGQLVHIGLVEGTALMPWSLVALEGLWRRGSQPGRYHRRAGAVALLGATSGLTVLAGDPRAVTTTAIVDLVYVLALLARAGTRRWSLLGSVVVGVGTGVLLSAVQWLPGLRFVHSSQRGVTAYSFFGAGSLSLSHLASFLLAPFLFGGFGNFQMPSYVGNYNLPELTIGVGVLATVAAMAFLPELTSQAVAAARRAASSWTASGRERDRTVRRAHQERGLAPRRRLGVWYVLTGVGVLLTLGTNTPLGHVLVHVPLFGGERLQNRNAAIFDLSLVVLMAFLIDDLLGRRAEHPLRSTAAKVLATVPLAGTAVLVALAYAAPSTMRAFMSIPESDTGLFTGMAPDMAWELALVVAVAAIVWRPLVCGSRRGRVGLAVLSLLDVAMFVVNDTYGAVPSQVLAGGGTAGRTLDRLVGKGGRLALYDPLGLDQGRLAVDEPGATPDLNVVQGITSVQGYGSIVGSTYENATSTHGYESLDLGGLAGTTFDVLDLRTLLTLPSYFEDPLGPSQAPPTPGSAIAGAFGTPAAGTPAAVVGGPYRVAAGAKRAFVLASPVPVTGVEIDVAGGGAGPSRLDIAVAVAGPSGARPLEAVSAAVHAGRARAAVERAVTGDEVVVTNPTTRAVVVDSVVVDTGSTNQRLALDGPLQGVLAPPHWRYAASLGPLVAWVSSRADGRAWLEPAGATAARRYPGLPGSVVVRAPSASAFEQAAVETPRPALLVRSESYDRGWTARITPLRGGASYAVPVEQLGLVQAVPVPAGRFEVTWHYRPAGVHFGLLTSAAGLGAVLALAGFALADLGGSRRRATGRT